MTQQQLNKLLKLINDTPNNADSDELSTALLQMTANARIYARAVLGFSPRTAVKADFYFRRYKIKSKTPKAEANASAFSLLKNLKKINFYIITTFR